MEPQVLQQLKEKLEQEKSRLERELSSIAEKDPHAKGDWNAKYPSNYGEISADRFEQSEEADEVEEYITRIPQEHTLEIQLQNVNKALQRIQQGTYGKCVRCGNEIDAQRLNAVPEAELCIDCATLEE